MPFGPGCLALLVLCRVHSIFFLIAVRRKKPVTAFGRQIPNIAEDRSFFTAEAYLVWATLYAPILLRDRLPGKYYRHFKLFLSVLARCMQFSTTLAERNTLRADVKKWYAQYERCV